MVYIGSARGNEWGGIYGGEPGDQTGGEVCTEPWYNSRLSWRTFRAKDPEVAKRIADDMQYACDNPNIGYNQRKNQTLYHIVKFLGWDCSKVEEPCDTDCSSLLRVCILYAGVSVPFFSTAEEPNTLLATGAFEELTGSQYTSSPALLKRGDILCTASKGHTVVVMNDGDGIGQKVDEDGLWGEATTKATQILYGTPVDGEIWKQYVFNKKYLPNATSGWKFGLFCGDGSPVIRKLQEAVGAYPDGVMGKKTVKALQIFLRAEGLYDGSIDGYLGPKSVLGWQKYLNRRFS